VIGIADTKAMRATKARTMNERMMVVWMTKSGIMNYEVVQHAVIQAQICKCYPAVRNASALLEKAKYVNKKNDQTSNESKWRAP
jgi:hypothetical protein